MYAAVLATGTEHYWGWGSGFPLCGQPMTVPGEVFERVRTCGQCYRSGRRLYAHIGRLLEDAQIKPRRGPVE